MSRWFRFYTGVVDDPKAQMLSPELFKHWVNVLCIAAQHDGILPDVAVSAFTLRMKPEKVAQVLTQLHGAGLLDKTETSFAPHNWNGRQYKTDETDVTNAERQKNFRKKKRDELNELKALRDHVRNGALRNGVTTVTAKRPDTDTDNITTTPLVETRKGLGRRDVDATSITASPSLLATLQGKGSA